jgi:hypothetical protein
MLKYFPDFDNLDLYSDVQLLDPRFEDDSDKNDEQPSLGFVWRPTWSTAIC